MTVVIGTAGHIDHGKTVLLRALTGIDADRLPEERRRGMTIDVGYAHMTLPDGAELDFVDVPGHDRLVGNMLVGAGEIDAAMLVVAADDGPSAQTIEHLQLLDALAIRFGLVVVTKADIVTLDRVGEVAGAAGQLLIGTSLEGSPVFAVSSVDGTGVATLRDALVSVRDRVVEAGALGRLVQASRLAIDRVFAVKGRGTVVTGSLRGRPLSRGASLRLVPGDRLVRVREVQVHGTAVDVAEPGRTALNLAGVESGELHRGLVLTDDPTVVASDRVLVRSAVRLTDRARARLHSGTAATDVSVGRSGRDALDLDDGSYAAILRLAAPVAVAPGDRLVLRGISGTERIVGAMVLDSTPARGISRRRQTVERVGRLASAVGAGDVRAIATARRDLHGALEPFGAGGPVEIASDVGGEIDAAILAAVDALGGVSTLAQIRDIAARTLRRHATIGRTAAAAAASARLERLVTDGRLVREGISVRRPGVNPVGPAIDPELASAMDRLERALAVAAPPGLDQAARAAGCPPSGIHELERSGRIVVLEPDLAYASSTYGAITAQTVQLAAGKPLTPAALRDATGTSRKYVMAILADLDRQGILRRTPDGHVRGPRAPVVAHVER